LAKASEMILTGEVIDAVEAKEFGLISRIEKPENLLSKANALADAICQNPARTLRLSKRLLREGQQSRLSDVLELSAAFQALAHETDDHAEAIDAFLGKRAPIFRGS
jgi:enoyl-CoA hydratase/carnithine racemase